MMSKFRELTAFMAVAEEGAFNAAARHLNVAPSAVTRLVNQLEDRIGAKLFTRTTRRVSLTEAGERLRAGATHVLEPMLQLAWVGGETRMCPTTKAHASISTKATCCRYRVSPHPTGANAGPALPMASTGRAMTRAVGNPA